MQTIPRTHSTHNTLGIVHKGNQQHTTETLGKFHTENITFSFANSMYKVACVCDLVLSQCSSLDVSCKLLGLRSATIGMKSRKANVSSFVLGGGSEVMFWEPQNSSLHHDGGEILLPMVAKSECTKCKQYIE